MKWKIGLLALGLIVVSGIYYFLSQSTELTKSGLIGNWKLESYNGNKNVPASITFQEDGKFNAKICNSYNGSYEVSAGTLKFNEAVGTLALCQDQALSRAENGLVQMSGVQKQTTKAYTRNGKLELYNNNDVFIFTKE